LALAALSVVVVSQARAQWGRAFTANSVGIAAVLATMAAGLYPWILPSHQGRPYGLSVHNAATSHHALVIALVWFSVAIVLALGYFTYSYRLLFRSPTA
jgi:cytochrome d ubiquinol oxidase subunit II